MLVFRDIIEEREFDGRDRREDASGRRADQPVWNVSMPTPFGWYYFLIRFGRERRSIGRLASEGQMSIARLSLAYTLAIWLVFGLIGLGVMVAVYLIKSYAGIDLMQGPSFLHNFAF